MPEYRYTHKDFYLLFQHMNSIADFFWISYLYGQFQCHKSDSPDALQELSIVLSDQRPEAEKMLRRLSAGDSAKKKTPSSDEVFQVIFCFFRISGNGAYGIRTHGLYNANVARSQLR